MKERNVYYSRRMKAASAENAAFPTILSVIVDLEDSSKTELPYLGTQYELGEKLEHHLTGAKMHGDQVRFFPTMNTARKVKIN